MADGVVRDVDDKFHYVHSCDVDSFLEVTRVPFPFSIGSFFSSQFLLKFTFLT